MTVAETAELAVRLSLDDAKFSAAISRIDKRLGAFSGAVNRNLGRAIDYGVARAARVLTGAFQGGVEALRELEVVTAQTEAVIASTGGTAGVTASKVRELAEKFEGLNATIDDRTIQSAENLLLTFTNIKADAFEPALQAVLDFSIATGKDATTAATLLGRALNDPAKGMGRLERAGISLDAKTRKRVEDLQKQGRLYEAQKVLLDELAKRYGGSFARNADTAAAKQAKLQDAVEDLQKAFATSLLPVVTKVGERITKYLADPKTQEAVKRIGDTIAALFTDENLDTAAAAIETAAKAVGMALDAFNQLPPEIKALAIGAFAINKVTGGAVGGIAKGLGSLIGSGLSKIFATNVTVVGTNVTGGVGGGPATGGSSKLTKALAGASIVADVVAVLATQQEVSAQNSAIASDIHQNLQDGIKTKTPKELQTALAGVEQGINDLQSNPLYVLVQGDALDQLKAMRAELTKEMETRNQPGFRQGERNATLPPRNPSIDQLRAKLADTINRQGAAIRSGDTKRAAALERKADRLRAEIDRRGRQTVAATDKNKTAVAGKLNTANAKLAAIQRKKTSFKITNNIGVTTSVSVSTLQQHSRYKQRVSKSSGLVAS